MDHMNRFTTYNVYDEKQYRIHFKYQEQWGNFELAGSKTHLRLCFIENSNLEIFIDNTLIPAHGNTIICLNEEQSCSIKSEKKVNIHILYFLPSTINSELTFETCRSENKVLNKSALFDKFLINVFINHTDGFIGIIQIGILEAERCKQLFMFIKNQLYNQDNPYWACKSRSYLLELLHYIMEIRQNFTKETLQINSDERDLAKIILYLNIHYNEKITLSELSRQFNTNRTTLSEKFKAKYKMSVLDYIKKIRIQTACTLLRDTNLPIYEIMYRIGYQDQTHFSRIFLEETSLSASEYRSTYQPDNLYL